MKTREKRQQMAKPIFTGVMRNSTRHAAETEKTR